ncbi:MAG: DUF5662 family protein [Lachnospiraceae bacterium]
MIRIGELKKYVFNAKSHFHVVVQHKKEVMKGCFAVGLYWQGITHDLSKFSPEEFRTGILYYQGNRSPNAAERELYGYSCAWLHHKGRNKHHYEYWTDVSRDRRQALEPKKMPPRYLAEMVMDRIAASKTYKGSAYTDAFSLQYLDLETGGSNHIMHPETYQELRKILTILAEQGEDAAFAYIRKMLRKGSY